MNMIYYYDRQNNFFEMFNEKTGSYVRTGILVDSKDTGVDPFMRNFPGLIDIGIMGHCKSFTACKAAGIDCYQGGGEKNIKPNMSFEDYVRIIDESKSKVMQVALGGHGNPDEHERFRDILAYTRENNIIPNYTTSGINLSDESIQATKEYCGAVAVSYQRAEHTFRAIIRLLSAGVSKVNIHYVLGEHTIDEAISLMENNGWPKGINAIIFLLYKPVGLGTQDKVLKDETKLRKFFELIDNHKENYKIGFDSCTIPAIINYCKKVDLDSVDTCEGGRFSMYISSDMIALPCSFDQSYYWGFDLKNGSIKQAWESPQFQNFRSFMLNSCPECPSRIHCMGGCPIKSEIVLCNSNHKHMFANSLKK